MRRDHVVKAACRGVNPEIFFPGPGKRPDEAKAVCRRCPVKAECLDDALRGGWRLEGIWAGLTETERRPLLKARAS